MASVEKWTGDNRWRAWLELGYDEAGKRRRRSKIINAKTERTALRMAKQLEADMHLEADRQALLRSEPWKVLTFAQLIDEWWKANPKNNASTTRATYRYQIETWIKPELGSVVLADLRPDVIYEWLHEVPEGLQPQTRNRHFAIVSGVCRWAASTNRMPFNPCASISRLTVRFSEVGIPELVDVRRVLDWIGERRPDIASAGWLALNTGARRSELFALRWSNVDTEAGELTIAHSLNSDRTLKSTKNGRPRRIAMNSEVVAEFDRLRRHQEEQKSAVLNRDAASEPGWFVFRKAAEPEIPSDPQVVSRWFHRACDALGCERVWFHGLRHLAATTMIAEGLDVRTVADILGNDPNVTMAIYAHATQKTSREAVTALGRVMGGLRGDG